jgi:hypothetical protein
MQVAGALGLALYGLGIPAWFGYVLLSNRSTVRADQEMRAQGAGWTDITNDHMLFRVKWQRLYRDFCPEAAWWRLVLLAKKTAMVAVVVFGNHYPMLQLPLIVGILAISGAAHLHTQPYLLAEFVSSVFDSLARTAKSLRLRRASMAANKARSQSWSSRLRIEYNAVESFGLLTSLVVFLFAMAFKGASDAEDARRILSNEQLTSAEQGDMLLGIETVRGADATVLEHGSNPLGTEPTRTYAAAAVIIVVVLSSAIFAGVVALEIMQVVSTMGVVLKARQLEEETSVLAAPDKAVEESMRSGATVANPLYVAVGARAAQPDAKRR